VTLLRQGEGDPHLPHPPVSAYPSTPTIFAGVRHAHAEARARGSGQARQVGGLGDGGVHLISNAGHVTGA